MCEGEKLISKEMNYIYSKILVISTVIVIIVSSCISTIVYFFLGGLEWKIHPEILPHFILSIHYPDIVFFVLISSLCSLLLIGIFELLSKNKKINNMFYLFLIEAYIGILGFINLYLVFFGMSREIIWK